MKNQSARGVGAQCVEIFVDVPPELAKYSGIQPVTLGIPFARGRLYETYGTRVVNRSGQPQLAQFQVTSWWGSNEVRWLLVDLLIPIKNGKAPRLFLEFGPHVRSTHAGAALQIAPLDATIASSTGAMEFLIGGNRHSLGQFVLQGVGLAGDMTYTAKASELQVELNGPVRAVVKIAGQYEATDGTKVAEFVTRARFYAGLPFVRLYHTLIWTTDATTRIHSLSLKTHPQIPLANVQTSVDGQKLPPSGSYELHQTDWDAVRDASEQRIGQHWDGWVEIKGANRSLFAALRWPWQQHPVGFAASGNELSIGLLAPATPLSLAAKDVVIPPFKNYSNPYLHPLSPTKRASQVHTAVELAGCQLRPHESY